MIPLPFTTEKVKLRLSTGSSRWFTSFNYENNLKQVRIYRNLLKKAKKQRDLVAERYKKYHASVDRIDKVQAYYIDIQLQNAAVITDFNKSVAQLEAVMCIDIYARERG